MEGPAEVPALLSVPADCCVMVHIDQALTSLLAAKHELQAKAYTHILAILWVKIFSEDLHGIERIDLQHLSVFTCLHTVYIDATFYGLGIKTFIVQNFSAMPANIRKVVCHTHPYGAEDILDLVGNDAAELVLRCDLGWRYTVEGGCAWDHIFAEHVNEGDEHIRICHIAERT